MTMRLKRRKALAAVVPFTTRLAPDVYQHILDIKEEEGCTVQDVVSSAVLLLAEKRRADQTAAAT